MLDANPLTRPDELLQVNSGRVTVGLGSASYEEVDFASESITHRSSELTAGDEISLNSAADLLIEGSDVIAGGSIDMVAGGDVVVRDVQDRYTETQEERHGTADLILVVQHQAVEVTNAAQALESAGSQLKAAEADYRNYQDEKKALEQTLAQLEADYAAGVAGISQSDITELSCPVRIVHTMGVGKVNQILLII